MPVKFPTYERVRLEGVIETVTPLCIGSGTSVTEDDREILQICADRDGNPYLPATSLRGLLSALAKARLDERAREKLFGTARDKEGRMGALRVYDARLDNPNEDKIEDYEQPERNDPEKKHPHQARRARAAIDPITGTAKDQHLYNFYSVPAGKSFSCTLELDRVDHAEVSALLGLLALLDGQTPEARLGKGATRLEGRIRWKSGKTGVLTQENLSRWLLNGRIGDAPEYMPLKIAGSAFNAVENRLIHVPYALYPQGPLLVDTVHVAPRKDKKDDEENTPGMRYRRDAQGRVLLSASSLRGMLRGHCRKILMTLLAHKITGSAPPYCVANKIADEMCDLLFGHTGRRGAIILSDAAAQNSVPHRQTFNAIDRFTGGVAKGALYTVEAATAKRLSGDIYIDGAKLQGEWWQGLLLLALRDGMEGDFAVGWGKAKGYGAVTVSIRETETWDALMHDRGGEIRKAVQALHQELESRIVPQNSPEAAT